MNKISKILFVSLILFCSSLSQAQTNFKAGWKTANPVKIKDSLSIDDKLKVHQAYWERAVADKNIINQIYGSLFLYEDFIVKQNYPEAAKHCHNIENLARASGNTAAQGYVTLKTSWLSLVVQKDAKMAVKQLWQGVSFCTEAKDSLCIGECLVQIASMHQDLNNLDSAYYYFKKAIPILKKYSLSNLNSAYNNFSILLYYQDRYKEAFEYLDSAIAIAQKENDVREMTTYITNRAVYLYELKQYDKAWANYKYSDSINTKNNWLDDLVFDYRGLYKIALIKKDYKTAVDYLEKYHVLKDSLTGAGVQLKIAGLNANDEAQKKEIILKQSQLALIRAERGIEQRTWTIFTVALVLVFIVSLWIAQQKKEKRKQAHTLGNLEHLTRILLEKNSLLTDIEQKISVLQEKSLEDDASLEQYLHDKNELLAQITETKHDSNGAVPSSEPDDFEKNIYNQRILTPSDWSAFKIYFEKAYPGYLIRLRQAFPSLTEAEERILLFAKLNLTNKEAAAILGISADSVKKTRSRLRKRLLLNDKTDLDEFVKKF